MAVDGISGNYTKYSSKQEPKEFNSSLDKDAFLKILVTQLSNQNPLEPVKDTEFIGQMAQFSTLEQAQNTNTAIKVNSANNMIFKLVTANYRDEGATTSREISGLVETVTMKNSNVYLTVNENGVMREILLEDVKEVTELTNASEQTYIMNQNLRIEFALSMVGKEVKGKYKAPSGTEGADANGMVEIEGRVEKIRKDGSNIYLTVNGKDVLLDNISEVKAPEQESGEETPQEDPGEEVPQEDI